ncbi:MAG TPA: PEMT/PEM2 methyltransferase family protein [Gemmatimonadales bacterium]|nr:PEMT/PEM2 methyltransferase family protein [Gemmatimonadales bacterium]
MARWVALGYAIASRLGYVCYVGLALRREEQSRSFTRQDGPAAGFQRFRRIASRIMTNDGVAFVAACVAGWDTLPDLGIPRIVLAAAGVVLVALGVGTKLWARATLGAEAYYWVNFFTDAPEVIPARTGPYRFLENPMYTVGYAHTYGLALVTASVPGLIAALFDQVAILAFHRLVEKPHFDRNRAVRAGPALSDDRHT